MTGHFQCLKSDSSGRHRSSSETRRGYRQLIAALSVAFLLGCEEQIIHDLGEAEANRVVSRLSVVALDAHKVQQSDGRWAVAVPEESILPALTFLESNRVLTPRGQPSANSKGGLVPSRQEQWFRYERAMAQSIEDSLAALSGVLEARVHVNLPESDPLFGTKQRDGGSGSVLLLIDDSFVASNDEISALVAGAAGIAAQQVTVLKSIAPKPSTDVSRDIDLEAAKVSSGVKERLDLSEVAASTEKSGLAPELLGAAAGVLVVLGAQVAWRRREPRLRFQRLDRREEE